MWTWTWTWRRTYSILNVHLQDIFYYEFFHQNSASALIQNLNLLRLYIYIYSNSPRYSNFKDNFAYSANIQSFFSVGEYAQCHVAYSAKMYIFIPLIWRIHTINTSSGFTSLRVFCESADFHSAYLAKTHSFIPRFRRKDLNTIRLVERSVSFNSLLKLLT
jgi:hypothetical protein